jgi:5-methylthioribose kinase
MPGKTYLPVQSGMPSPCSQPVKLVSVSAVKAFLADTPFACRSITELTGGHINYVYRVHLQTPVEGSKTVVLKHAQPFWKSSVVKSWEVGRQVRAKEDYPMISLTPLRLDV